MRVWLVIGLVLLFSLQVTARGGGRSSGGSYSSSSYSYRSSSYSRSYYGGGGGGGDMPVWAIILIVVLLVGVLLCICFSMSDTNDQVGFKNVERQDSTYSRTFHYEGTIPCYLCLNKVKNSDWDSGEHRKRCAFNNQRELLSFPQPYESYCPNCNEKLRLWPAKGHPFYCDECPFQERDKLKRSTGHNRLNCFLCDFDCCVNCSTNSKFQKAYPDARSLVDDKTGVSDDDIERMAAGMATVQSLETAVKEEECERIEKVCGEAEPSSKREPYDGRIEEIKNEFPTNNFSKDQTMNIPSPDFTTHYNPSPFNPSIPSVSSQPSHYSSPFILPPPTDQQEYPTPSYSDSYTSSIGQPPPSSNPSFPYNNPPPIGLASPPTHPSLPYGITPYSHTNQTTTSTTTTTTSTEYSPSAPPLIQRY